MAGGGSGDEEENYWPGFVDALTVMTMVLTFIMMVLGLVVFSLSQNTSRAQLSQIAAVAKIDVSAASLEQMQQKLLDALKARNPDPDKTPEPAPEPKREAAAPAASDTERRVVSSEKALEAPKGSVRVVGRENAFTLLFEERGFQLDAAVADEIVAFTEAGASRSSEGVYAVRAYAKIGTGSVSEARKLAYYRGMVIRQQLVKSGIPPERVRVKVDDASSPETENVVKILID